MTLKPVDDRFDSVFDYLLNTYITPDSTFPPDIWAECTESSQRTTSSCEAFHSRLNNLFTSSHPNIFFLIDTLIEIQSETYIRVRSAPRNPSILLKEKYIKGTLYPRGNSELMYYKLLTILREIVLKFGLDFVQIIISSCNRISTLKIDPIHHHAKFHQIWFSTIVVISILRSRYS